MILFKKKTLLHILAKFRANIFNCGNLIFNRQTYQKQKFVKRKDVCDSNCTSFERIVWLI